MNNEQWDQTECAKGTVDEAPPDWDSAKGSKGKCKREDEQAGNHSGFYDP